MIDAIISKHCHHGRIYWVITECGSWFNPPEIRSNPPKEPSTPQKKFNPQKCPFLPTEGTIFQKKLPAAHFNSILITKMSFFIDEMCHWTVWFKSKTELKKYLGTWKINFFPLMTMMIRLGPLAQRDVRLTPKTI